MIDIKAIREAAEAATPGPWVLGTSGDERFSRVHNYVEDCAPKWDELLLENVPTLILYDIQAENAKHIATANPATVLAMCDEIERLRKENEKLLEIFKVKHHAALRFFEKEAALEAKLVEVEKDAARYVWWRNNACHHPAKVAVMIGPLIYPEQFDAAIDAAMGSK